LFAALGGSTYAATSIVGSGGIHFKKATYKNGWHTYPHPGYASAGYAKDSLGVVHLRGGISGATNDTTAFVLPSGLRPRHYLFLPAYTYLYSEGSVEIKPGGEVIPIGSDVTSYTSLDGISFAAGE
jgi:hypothetical protein